MNTKRSFEQVITMVNAIISDFLNFKDETFNKINIHIMMNYNVYKTTYYNYFFVFTFYPIDK